VTVALVFPGQGSDLAELRGYGRVYPEPARRLLQCASESVRLDLPTLLERGAAVLRRTDVFQPLLTALALGKAKELRAAGVHVHAVLGHSLGELSAWAAAGCADEEAVIELAAVRGRLMREAAGDHSGGMVAVRQGSPGALRRALRRGREHGTLCLAAHNAPSEWVLSGDLRALGVASAAYGSQRLQVEGAWHSNHMRGVSAAYQAAIARVPCRSGHTTFVSSVTGKVMAHDRIGDALLAALERPVRWRRAVQSLAALGVTDYVVAGPERPLRSLLRRNLSSRCRLWGVDELVDRHEELRSAGLEKAGARA